MAEKGWRWRSTRQLAASLSSCPQPAAATAGQLAALLAELRTLLPSLPSDCDKPGGLVSACLAALRVVDRNLLAAVQEAADAALASLDMLEVAKDSQQLSVLLKVTRKKMVQFLKVVIHRHGDCEHAELQEEVATRAEAIRSLLPVIYSSLQEGQEGRRALSYFLGQLRLIICDLVHLLERNQLRASSRTGEFLNSMDAVLEAESAPNLDQFTNTTKALVRHALAVAAAAAGNEEDDRDISVICRNIVDRLNGLEEERVEELQRLLELLEERVNGALLRQVTHHLSCADMPLDSLVHRALERSPDNVDAKPENLEADIVRLDEQTDGVVELCQLCIPCTRNSHQAGQLRAAARLLDILEPELVPTIIQVYLHPEDVSAKILLKYLRQTWKATLEKVVFAVKKIVDPAAFCLVVAAEAVKLGKQLSSRLYEQEAAALRCTAHQLVGMCEMGVDLAWEEAGRRTGSVPQPLADSHPLVRTERAVWEVRAAGRLLLTSMQDLDLHQSFMKRVKVLVSTSSDLANRLLADQEEEEVNRQQTVETQLGSPCPSPSSAMTPLSAGWISFRSKRHLDRTAALADSLRKNMYKLTADLAPFTPEPTPRRRRSLRKNLLLSLQRGPLCLGSSPAGGRHAAPNRPISGGQLLVPQTVPPMTSDNLTPRLPRREPPCIQRTPEATARLSSVLEDLSALSHELSVNLGSGGGGGKMAPVTGSPASQAALHRIRENCAE